MDCSLQDSSVHKISQAGILEWAAMPSPGDLPNPGIKLKHWQVSSLPLMPPGKPIAYYKGLQNTAALFFFIIIY